MIGRCDFITLMAAQRHGRPRQAHGWVAGNNIQIDFQWGLGDADWMKSAAAQFQRLAFLKMSQFRGNTRQIGGNDVNLQGRSAKRVADLACDC